MSLRRSMLIAALGAVFAQTQPEPDYSQVKPVANKPKRTRKDRRADARRAAKPQPDQPAQEVDK